MKLLDVLKKWARGVPPDASPQARAKADGIRGAISTHAALCRHCFNPYVPKPRDFAEQFRVRAILMIPDSEPELMLCDACFETVVSVYNARATVPGTSNAGPRNFLLS